MYKFEKTWISGQKIFTSLVDETTETELPPVWGGSPRTLSKNLDQRNGNRQKHFFLLFLLLLYPAINLISPILQSQATHITINK
jgi:hypothetical protein